MALGQSKDFAREIADLIQKGAAAGSRDAQEALVQLHTRANEGDERVKNILNDAASRVREGRQTVEDVPAEEIIGRIAELLDPEKFEEAKKKTPTPREEKLLQIIKIQHAKLQSFG